MPRVLYVITEDWALVSHRLHLVQAAISKGYSVAVATNFTEYRAYFETLGIKTYLWPLSRSSLNPFSELRSIIALHHIVMAFNPDLVHAVAQKPVIYAGLLKRFGGDFAFLAALGGIGFIFTSNKLKAKILKYVVCLSLRFALAGRNTILLLQNLENKNAFVELNIIDKGNIYLIKGSGVEIEKFTPSKIPDTSPTIILPARMLWDKGVREFVNASRTFKQNNIEARFVLVGDIDIHNSLSVTLKDIDFWVKNGWVEHLCRQKEMQNIYRKAWIVCLPSYHEGMPKVLAEASACARPTVAFDVPGSREIVKHELNGFLIDLHDQNGLNSALLTLVQNKALCEKYGRAGRILVEEEFSDKKINTATFKLYEILMV